MQAIQLAHTGIEDQAALPRKPRYMPLVAA
jgi:hypothetical protein